MNQGKRDSLSSNPFQETPESYLKRILGDVNNGIKYLEVALRNSRFLELPELASGSEARMREGIDLGKESLSKAIEGIEVFNEKFRR